jgi:sulfur-carrier protein
MRVLYFAWVRQRVGLAEEDLLLPPAIRDVASLIGFLAARSPGHAAAFADPQQIRCAVNQDFADPTTPVAPGDEIAFFPPVTGG